MLWQVSVDSCVEALSATEYNIHKAVKLLKLRQLLNTSGLRADKRTCKLALKSAQWNVHDAVTALQHQQMTTKGANTLK